MGSTGLGVVGSRGGRGQGIGNGWVEDGGFWRWWGQGGSEGLEVVGPRDGRGLGMVGIQG